MVRSSTRPARELGEHVARDGERGRALVRLDLRLARMGTRMTSFEDLGSADIEQLRCRLAEYSLVHE
jgi:hypothetical protein